MNRITVLLMVCVVISSPFATATTMPTATTMAAGTTMATGTKILMFGDFGTGDSNQKKVANKMINYCKTKGCDFAITTGDNIYPSGVDNDQNGKPNYELIEKYFVDMYKPLNIPIYMSFGNHDVGNNGVVSTFKNFFSNQDEINNKTEILMRNQLGFSNDEENPIIQNDNYKEESAKLWVFPDAFYEKNVADNVSIFAIDTNAYPHSAFKEEEQTIDKENAQNSRQATWLDEALDIPSSKWKIVFGHQPLISHGVHGFSDRADIQKFRDSIIENLCDNEVDFYVSGHDHHLEIDKYQCPQGHVITSILTGAAAKETDIRKMTFPFFGEDENLLWANGIKYQGKSGDFSGNTRALGFAYLNIIDDEQAQIRMVLAKKARNEQQDESCFLVKRGKQPNGDEKEKSKPNDIKEVSCSE